MRLEPRNRRSINPIALAAIRPLLRYSYTREAYVVRGIGNRYGPVFVRGASAAPEERHDQAE